MISVEQALKLIEQHAKPRTACRIQSADALGRVLAAEVTSDIDSPPHDKALMDGYAVIATDVVPGVKLNILEEVTAGDVPTLPEPTLWPVTALTCPVYGRKLKLSIIRCPTVFSTR